MNGSLLKLQAEQAMMSEKLGRGMKKMTLEHHSEIFRCQWV